MSSGNCEPGHVSTVVGEPASTALTYRVAGSAHCGGDNWIIWEIIAEILGYLGLRLCFKPFQGVGTHLILLMTLWSRSHYPHFTGVEVAAVVYGTCPIQWLSFHQRSEGTIVASAPLLLTAFVIPQLLMVSCIIYWALTVFLVLLEMEALRADSDRSKIGRRKWYLGLSCQKLVILDTWPAQKCRARRRPVRAQGEKGGDLYLSARFEVYSEPSLCRVLKEHIQEGTRGEEQVYSLQQWKCSGLALP